MSFGRSIPMLGISMMGIFPAIFDGLIWPETRLPKRDGCPSCHEPKSEISISSRKGRQRILKPDIYNVPLMTCFRSPVFGRPYRLVPFTGCSHCDVPRRAFPSPIRARARACWHRAQEMTRYLALIKTTWEYILGAEDELRSNLDGATVIILEGRCPKFSKNDESLLWDKQSDIFPTISVTRVRSLLARVQTIDYTIPSIHTFLEDTKLLEPCAKLVLANSEAIQNQRMHKQICK